uniref:Cotton fiber protein n=1 Tax=Noccaea caerulescens TaxID=107243 RepID=A0A1J3IPX4_NOCCA
MAKSKDGSLLNRLRQAVNKVKFVLSFKLHSLWGLVPMLGSSSSSSSLRFSFNDRPGLAAAYTEENESDSTGSSRRALRRMQSYDPSSDEDIDNKAEMFIANFYKQLKIERQISLELKYCHGNNQSFNYRSP